MELGSKVGVTVTVGLDVFFWVLAGAFVAVASGVTWGEPGVVQAASSRQVSNTKYSERGKWSILSFLSISSMHTVAEKKRQKLPIPPDWQFLAVRRMMVCYFM